VRRVRGHQQERVADRREQRHRAQRAGRASPDASALFTSSSLRTALPAAVAIGMSGSMALVIPQTTVQRLIPDAALGRVSAIFLTGGRFGRAAHAVRGGAGAPDGAAPARYQGHGRRRGGTSLRSG
jgi:hypothetical protein